MASMGLEWMYSTGRNLRDLALVAQGPVNPIDRALSLGLNTVLVAVAIIVLIVAVYLARRYFVEEDTLPDKDELLADFEAAHRVGELTNQELEVIRRRLSNAPGSADPGVSSPTSGDATSDKKTLPNTQSDPQSPASPAS